MPTYGAAFTSERMIAAIPPKSREYAANAKCLCPGSKPPDESIGAASLSHQSTSCGSPKIAKYGRSIFFSLPDFEQWLNVAQTLPRPQGKQARKKA